MQNVEKTIDTLQNVEYTTDNLQNVGGESNGSFSEAVEAGKRDITDRNGNEVRST